MCSTVDQQLQEFTANAALQLVPAHAANAPNTCLVTTCLSLFIPCALVPCVIGQHLTLREVLTTLVPIICDLELEPHVGPLLDFLLAASTLPDDGEPATMHDALGTRPELGGAQVASDRCKKLLFAQLPKLQPATPAQRDPATTGIMRAMEDMHNLTTADLANCRAEKEDKKKDKTVPEKWPGYSDCLCTLCDLEDWTALPECWRSAAVLKKGGGATLALLQDQVNVLAAQLDCLPLLVTTQHDNAITGWTFGGGLSHQLGTGVLPFTVTSPGAVSPEVTAQLERKRDSVQDFKTVMGGTAITAGRRPAERHALGDPTSPSVGMRPRTCWSRTAPS